MLSFLANLDRRWIFLLMFLSVGLAILAGVRFPEKPSAMTRDIFDAVDQLPDGSRILIALDYDPAGRGELQPMANAFTRHCALKNHRIYFLTIWPQGPPLIQNCVSILESEFPEYEYGQDFVNLGFRAGLEGVIKVIVTNLRQSFSTDHAGTRLEKIPMTKDLKSIQEMDLIVSVSAGDPGVKEWIQYASTPYGIPTVSGCTGVQAPIVYPYIPRQLIGVLGGIKSAAEYEQALIEGYPDLDENENAQEALRRMGPQVVAHVLMISLIVLGNVVFFAQRRRGDQK